MAAFLLSAGFSASQQNLMDISGATLILRHRFR